ncbi:MAG: GLPGLI family protein [Muribaculaceae bacterium]|nr:GLPGLI family protein [Muribaculaceae bacterium]
MKKILSYITIWFAAIPATGQTASIEVSYTAHSPNFRDGKSDNTNQYILLANNEESKFFSPMTEYIDSLVSTPDGKAKFQEMSQNAYLAGKFDQLPRKDGTYYIVKSLRNKSLKYYDTAGLDKYFYEEPMEELMWELVDSTKNILGYECFNATVESHGRKWTAWFTPEIPVQNGPWKFDGLPGLVLEAAAEGNQYQFIATGVQQTNKAIGKIYLTEEYEKSSRKDFLKAKRSFIDNPLGKINAVFGGSSVVKVTDEDGSDTTGAIFAPASVVDFIETDY